jgi:hypothetical protein
MMIERARRLCPSLQVLSPHLSRVSSANLSLLSVVMRYAPVSELSPGVVADLCRRIELFTRPRLYRMMKKGLVSALGNWKSEADLALPDQFLQNRGDS